MINLLTVPVNVLYWVHTTKENNMSYSTSLEEIISETERGRRCQKEDLQKACKHFGLHQKGTKEELWMRLYHLEVTPKKARERFFI
ncbi:hypothetical protein AHIS2_p052 [Acaryochloris phage A-HIS2]|nr:hypothetical protein AHIS2_p052 [Acaryochloris phage A-HIS2]